jgi:hypothetical protein
MCFTANMLDMMEIFDMDAISDDFNSYEKNPGENLTTG